MACKGKFDLMAIEKIEGFGVIVRKILGPCDMEKRENDCAEGRNMITSICHQSLHMHNLIFFGLVFSAADVMIVS